jgi:hypothetical protein
VIRKFFPLDKNYLLEEAQLSLQETLLLALVEKAKSQYELRNNPLQIDDAFSLKIKNYRLKNFKPLLGFYQTLAGIYRYKFGNNQLELIWDGQSHFEKYQTEWAETFEQWSCLSVFLPENRQAQLAENRMNFVMLTFFSELDGFPELTLRKSRGVLEMKVAYRSSKLQKA